MKTLQLEFYKIKRRKVWLTMFALLSVQLLWGLWAFRNPKDWELKDGWLSLLYFLPILDGIMMPTMMSVLASRLADIEHKGNTYKQLETLRRAGSLYHSKAICGCIITAVLFVVQYAFFIALGITLGYEGNPDVKYYLLSYILTLASNLSLFLLQLALSMFFANQMIPLVAGLGGSMAALLIMFVTTHSFLPWGGNLSGLRFKNYLLKGEFLMNISLIKTMKAEQLKLKHSPVWLAFFILPVISAFFGTSNYLIKQSIVGSDWYSLWTQHTLFLCYFFMPALIGTYCSYLWRLEHMRNNWNSFLTAPVPLFSLCSTFYAAKSAV